MCKLNLKTFENYFYVMPAFIFGLGYIKESISYLILFVLFFIFSRNAQRLKNQILGSIMGVLWILFFILYYVYFIPPDLPWGKVPLDLYNYFQKSFPIVLLYFLVLCLPKLKNSYILVFSIVLGMHSLAIGNITATLLYLDPPYYGKVFHCIQRSVYNSPGTTILGSMLPITLLSIRVNECRHLYIITLAFAILTSLIISFLLSARTPIFLILIASTLNLILVNQDFKENLSLKNIIFFTFLTFISLGLFYLFQPSYFKSLIYRLINSEYSVKIQHHKDYFVQIKDNFWIYPNANWVVKYEWFHNFFFDSHRTSGPYTALVGYLIFFLSLINGIFYGIQKIGKSTEKLVFLLAFIPILFTSIPWESSEYQLTGLFACITGLIFRKN